MSDAIDRFARMLEEALRRRSDEIFRDLETLAERERDMDTVYFAALEEVADMVSEARERFRTEDRTGWLACGQTATEQGLAEPVRKGEG